MFNIIPCLRHKDKLVKQGQVCKCKNAALSFYTALSWKNAIYTNIKGEEPLTEMEILTLGRSEAILGYGEGEKVMNMKTGALGWRPMKLLEFFKLIRSTRHPNTGDSPMPALYIKSESGTPRYDIETGEEANFECVKGIELLIDNKSECAWAGKDHKKYIKKLSDVLKNGYVGFIGGVPDPDIVALSAVKHGDLTLFKSAGEGSMIKILNSRAVNLLYN